MPADESLAELFRLVNRRLRYLARQSLEPWDVTVGQSRALGVLLRGGPLRLNELVSLPIQSRTSLARGVKIQAMRDRRLPKAVRAFLRQLLDALPPPRSP